MPEISSNGQISDYEPVTRTGGTRWENHGEADSFRPRRTDVRPPTASVQPHPATPDFVAPDHARHAASSSSTVEPASSGLAGLEKWIHKRSHAVTYAGLFLFTVVLYFRPYEYLPSLPVTLAFWIAAVTFLIFIPSQLAAEGTFTARPREVNLILLLTLTALLSMPLGTSPADSWTSFNDTLAKTVVVFIMMVNAVSTERRLKGLLLLALAVSCVLSFSAINDYRLGRATTEGYRVAGSIGGMFSNPNYMALHLVTMLPIPLCMFLSGRGLLKRFVYIGIILLILTACVLTFSRGAFLGLIGMSAVLVWKLGHRNRFGIMLLVLLLVPLVFLLAPGAYGNRIASIFDSSLDPNGSSTIRQQVFWKSIYVTIANPVFGVGIGNFHIVSFRELVSHNAYTQVSSEMGVAALTIYVMFIVTPLKRLRQIERETFARRRGSRVYYLAVGLQASLVAYMISSFFASVAFEWYIYYLVAYAVALRRIYLSGLPATDALSAAATAGETTGATAGADRRYGEGNGAVLTA